MSPPFPFASLSHRRTYLRRIALRNKVCAVRVPPLLKGQQSLLEPLLIDLFPGYDTSGVAGEVVVEASAEKINRPVSKADAVKLGWLVKMNVGRIEESGELLLDEIRGRRGHDGEESLDRVECGCNWIWAGG